MESIRLVLTHPDSDADHGNGVVDHEEAELACKVQGAAELVGIVHFSHLAAATL